MSENFLKYHAIERNRRREMFRKNRQAYKRDSGISAFLCFAVAGFWLFAGLTATKGGVILIGMGLLMLFCARLDTLDAIHGKPTRPGRSKHSPMWKRELHIPDCSACRGYGRISRGFASGLFYRVPFVECPVCYGCGKERHEGNEWYYNKKEGTDDE